MRIALDVAAGLWLPVIGLCLLGGAIGYVTGWRQRHKHPAPRVPPGAAPGLTPKEQAALHRAATWATICGEHRVEAARELADALRGNFPHVPDLELGRLALHMSWIHRAHTRRGAPPEDLTGALALAAVELTELERQEAPR